MDSKEIFDNIHSDTRMKSGEEPDSSSSINPLLLRLHQALSQCSTSVKSLFLALYFFYALFLMFFFFWQVVEGDDFRKSEQSILELVDFLNSISDFIVNEPENNIVENNGFQILSKIHIYIADSTLNQVFFAFHISLVIIIFIT